MKLRFHRSAPTGCGECTLCCKVLGIDDPEFTKAQGVWCQHAAKGVGCKIYDTRPQPCREFQCLWLMGVFGESRGEFRPDRLHAVMSATSTGNGWLIHEDPGYRGYARLVLRREIENFLKQDPDAHVIIVCGGERLFLGDPKKFQSLASAAEVTHENR